MPNEAATLSIADINNNSLIVTFDYLDVNSSGSMENIHLLECRENETPFLDKLIAQFPNEDLNTLNLDGVCAIDNWLDAESLPNLCELRLSIGKNSPESRQDVLNIEHLIRFISSKPSLHTIYYDGKNRDAIFNAVAQHIPNIEEFGPLCADDGCMYLESFKRLKRTSLVSFAPDFSDCGKMFRTWAQHNTLEYLIISNENSPQLCNDPVQMDDLKRLTKFKTLILHKLVRISNEFLSKLFGSLPSLEMCVFVDNSSFSKSKLITAIQHSRTLKSVIITFEMSMFSLLFYEKLMLARMEAICGWEENSMPLVIFTKQTEQIIANLNFAYQPSVIAFRSL